MTGLFPDSFQIFIVVVVGMGSAVGGIVGGYKAALAKTNSNGNGNGNRNNGHYHNKYMSEETKTTINALTNEHKGDLEKLWSAKQDNKTCEVIHKALDKRLQTMEDDIKEILKAVRNL